MEAFMARQPIVTTEKKVFGYELLFRDGLENAFPRIDGDVATSNLLSNIFFPFDFNEIIGGKPGLVNFTKKGLKIIRGILSYRNKGEAMSGINDIRDLEHDKMQFQANKDVARRSLTGSFIYLILWFTIIIPNKFYITAQQECLWFSALIIILST